MNGLLHTTDGPDAVHSGVLIILERIFNLAHSGQSSRNSDELETFWIISENVIVGITFAILIVDVTTTRVTVSEFPQFVRSNFPDVQESAVATDIDIMWHEETLAKNNMHTMLF